jgi:uncharacterized protein with WD repeat
VESCGGAAGCVLTSDVAAAAAAAAAACCNVLQDFEWSPAEALLAAYTQEVGDRPANITLYRIPERTSVRSKQLFNVSGELITVAAAWF